MLEHLFRCPQVQHRLQAHPVADFLSQFATHLHSRGYAQPRFAILFGLSNILPPGFIPRGWPSLR